MSQHHRVLLRVRVSGVYLGMSGKMVSGQIDGFLIEGIGDGAVHLVCHGHSDGLLHIAEGCLPRLGRHPADGQRVRVHQAHVEHIDHTGGIFGCRRGIHRMDANVFQSGDIPGTLQHTGVPHHERSANLIDFRPRQRLDGDLRANGCGISHGNGKNRFFHVNTPCAMSVRSVFADPSAGSHLRSHPTY